MKRLLKAIFGRKPATIRKTNKQRFQPTLDTLEQRLALNFDFATPALPGQDVADIEDDVLYIRGTDGNDLITLEIEDDNPNQVRATVYQLDGWNLVELDSDDFWINNFDAIEIRGFDGNDTIANMTHLATTMFGGEDHDDLFSGSGDDVMVGGAGNDDYEFYPELNSIKFPGVEYNFDTFGSDTIVEETAQGSDRLRLRELQTGVNLDLANANPQAVAPGILNLTLRNAANQVSEIEKVYGTDYADTIFGNHLANHLYGYSGDDVLVGRAGNDSLYGSSGNDTLEGQDGDDYLSGDFDNDTYVFNNLVVSNLGKDTVREYSGRGQDTFDFSAMVLDQYMMGINLDLAITGDQDLDYGSYSPFALELNLSTAEIEDVKATDGYDNVKGNALDNHIWTYGMGDNLEGRGGNDILEGGSYNDSYVFNNQSTTNLGHDTVVETSYADSDRLNFYSMDRGVLVNLASTGIQTVASGALQLTLSSSTGIENVSGTQYADTIYGNSRNNNIYAYNGDDWVYGYSGNDTLGGGNGIDRLYGGNNHDRLDGGNHNDYLYGEGGQDTLIGGDGADYLNGDYLNHYTSDGYNDQLYGYTQYSNTDGDRDMFVHHRRYVYQNGRYTSVDAGWETLAGFNSSEDIRHYYYSWSF